MTNTTEQTAAPFAPGITMHHATRTKADKLWTMLASEYPRLDFSAHADANDVLTHFTVIFDRHGEDEVEVYTGPKVPSLALVLDACAEEDLDPSAPEEEEEPQVSGSVVPEKYRADYRLNSTTGRCNGDWLAEQLANDTLDAKGNLVLDDFIAVLERNAVPLTGKWAGLRFGGGRGWQGRFRMNGRQVLEKLVCKAGAYVDATGQTLTPSTEWMADMAVKHAKWLAKEAKREAAATEAVKSAIEGEPTAIDANPIAVDDDHPEVDMTVEAE